MTVQIHFTRKTVVVLVGVALLVAALVAAGVAVAQTPNEPSGDADLELAAYDGTLYPKLPQMMNYQGVLTEDDGTPVDGSHDLTFTIYEYRRLGMNPATWNSVYSETQSVQVHDGLFNVVIGEVNPLDPGEFGGLWRFMFLISGGSLELGVKVDGGPELTPRAKLLPVPYAFRAEYVNRFPAPHYNSGWVAVSAGNTREFAHNLGGDPDNYVVDMTCKSTLSPPFDAGVHNWFLGGENYYNAFTDDLLQYGAFWRKLEEDSIEVYRQADDSNCGQVRIRIWRID